MVSIAPTIQVSSEEVVEAICSFPCGSAGGPGGLRPQYLKDMIRISAGEGGRVVLQSLNIFVNFVLAGDVASLAQPYFFGATLTALNKKDGGVRPIAVGCTLRRLVAKCAGARIMRAMGAHLAPTGLWGSYGGGGSCPCGSHFPSSPAAGPSPFEA